MENISNVEVSSTVLSLDIPYTSPGAWWLNFTKHNINHHNSWDLFNDTSNGTEGAKVFLPCNNPDNLIDEATALKVEAVIQTTILPLLELFGIITNVINGLVFVKQGLKDRINLCLFSLALADIFFLVLVFATKCYSLLGLVDKELEEYWRYRSRNTVLGPMLGALNISNLMTLIIAVERCVCVLSPFTAKRYLKTRSLLPFVCLQNPADYIYRSFAVLKLGYFLLSVLGNRYMAVLIISMAIYVLGFYSLLNMKYKLVLIVNSSNTTRRVPRLTAFYLNNRIVIDILYNHLLSLCIPCVSLVVVIVTTSITVHRLRVSLSWRSQTANKATAGDRREDAVTKMLTVICFIYVTTMSLSVTQVFFRTLFPGYLPTGKLCNTINMIQPLVHVCQVTNSSVNFIVYFCMGSKYRATLRQLFTFRPKSKCPVESLQTASTCEPGLS